MPTYHSISIPRHLFIVQEKPVWRIKEQPISQGGQSPLPKPYNQGFGGIENSPAALSAQQLARTGTWYLSARDRRNARAALLILAPPPCAQASQAPRTARAALLLVPAPPRRPHEHAAPRVPRTCTPDRRPVVHCASARAPGAGFVPNSPVAHWDDARRMSARVGAGAEAGTERAPSSRRRTRCREAEKRGERTYLYASPPQGLENPRAGTDDHMRTGAGEHDALASGVQVGGVLRGATTMSAGGPLSPVPSSNLSSIVKKAGFSAILVTVDVASDDRQARNWCARAAAGTHGDQQALEIRGRKPGFSRRLEKTKDEQEILRN
ncbi:hypothetical protein DFH09DRAFT_1315593 [Mycena vulgaris]|nr:hypothetical protein DFH09DRAFT_1315593 [Mycena vulgaris]